MLCCGRRSHGGATRHDAPNATSGRAAPAACACSWSCAAPSPTPPQPPRRTRGACERRRWRRAGAADQNVVAAAVALGKQCKQVPRRRQVRHQDAIEHFAQARHRLVEQPAATRCAAHRGDDTRKRTPEVAQGRRELGAIAVITNRLDDDLDIRSGMLTAQCLELAQVAGDGDHRNSFGDGRSDDAATNQAGCTEHDDRGFHCPGFRIVCPENGTVAALRSGALAASFMNRNLVIVGGCAR